MLTRKGKPPQDASEPRGQKSRKFRHPSRGSRTLSHASTPPSAPGHGKAVLRTDWIIVALLIALNLAIYAQIGRHEFIALDDDEYLTRNPIVQSGLTARGIAWAFTTFHAANWHPLTWLSHMADYSLFGANAGGHHLSSLVLHILATVLFFSAFRTMTGAVWRSGVVAALFAAHPLHVESVAWTAERKDVLSTLFLALALCAYARYARRPSRGIYLALIACHALGLMAKPMLVTLPFLLLLLDVWPLGRMALAGSAARGAGSNASGLRGKRPSAAGGRPAGHEGGEATPESQSIGSEQHAVSNATPAEGPAQRQGGSANVGVADRRPAAPRSWSRAAGAPRSGERWRLQDALVPLIREKLPLFALSIASSAITFVAQRSGGAVRQLVEFPLPDRLANSAVAAAGYLVSAIWPARLAVYYPFPAEGWPTWRILASVLAIAAATLLVVWGARSRGYLATGWLWYLGTLVPVVGIVQVGGQSSADRYTYIPLIGIFVIVAWGAVDVTERLRLPRPALASAAAAALVALSFAAWRQVSLWRDSTTLFEHTLDVTSDNLVIHYNLGYVLGQKGEPEEAIPHFEASLGVDPDFYNALFNMGVALAAQGKYAEAVGYYERALRVRPESAEARRELGVAHAQQGDLGRAAAALGEAMRLDPEDAGTRTNLGLVLLRSGEFREATEILQEAVRLDPASPQAHNNLGLAFAVQGRTDEARKHFFRAIDLKTDYAEARDNLRRLDAMDRSP